MLAAQPSLHGTPTHPAGPLQHRWQIKLQQKEDQRGEMRDSHCHQLMVTLHDYVPGHRHSAICWCLLWVWEPHEALLIDLAPPQGAFELEMLQEQTNWSASA